MRQDGLQANIAVLVQYLLCPFCHFADIAGARLLSACEPKRISKAKSELTPDANLETGAVRWAGKKRISLHPVPFHRPILITKRVFARGNDKCCSAVGARADDATPLMPVPQYFLNDRQMLFPL